MMKLLAERLFTEIRGHEPTSADAFSIQSIENLLSTGWNREPPAEILQFRDKLRTLITDIEIMYGLEPACDDYCECPCHED